MPTIDFTPLLTSSARSGDDPGRPGEDARSRQGAGGLQAGGRSARDRGADPRRAEIGVHRPAGAGQGPEAAGELPGLQGADRRAGESRRGGRQRHPGRPVLGADAGLLRPAAGDAVQRQRPVRRQPDRHACRRRRADRAALARRHQTGRSPWSTGCRRAPRRSSSRPSRRCRRIWTARAGEAAHAAHRRHRQAAARWRP